MFSLNRSMQYSIPDTIWFVLMCINNILALVVLHHTAKTINVFVNTKLASTPGGYWMIVAFIVSTTILSAVLVHKSKTSMNKPVAWFFTTGAPLFLTGYAVYLLWNNVLK